MIWAATLFLAGFGAGALFGLAVLSAPLMRARELLDQIGRRPL